MKRILERSLLVVLLCMLAYGIYSAVYRRKLQQQAAKEELQCNTELEKLQRDLPKGTSREGVQAYLRLRGSHLTTFGGRDDEIWVDLGKVHSTVWFCSFWEEYAQISFRDRSEPDKEVLSTIASRSIGECL